MPYNVLAINPGHNGSAALTSDGNIIYYIEEERLSRMKYDGNPFRSMIHVLLSFPIDELVIGGTTNELHQLPWTGEDSYTALVRKFNPNVKITKIGHLHHLGHAANTFYGSGFETAAAVIVDGAGSLHVEQIGDTGQTIHGYETETIYHCSYPHEFNAVYKRYSNGDGNSSYYDNGIQEFDGSVTITKAYEAVSDYLGFGFIEAGKTMGLAPYGQFDENIPEFFVNNKGNKNLLIPRYPAGAFIDENRYLILKRFMEPSAWHKDFNLVREIDKNLAWHVQRDTEEQMYNLIQKAHDITGETNIVISGGFGLNCVANYKYLKKFPNFKFYIDPISHDGGTALGLARYAYYIHTQSTELKKLSTIFLGPPPSYDQLENIAKENPMTISSVTAKDIASLITEGNIVALFQGRSEGGPRALGNRSILFDPRNVQGKDIVNRVKMREWFRPFAGSVLAEDADDWFDMAGLDESPFMMYAVNVREDKVNIIPAVTHVDNTCRVQTVNETDNPNFYQLIKEFKLLTDVPVLFNTSFNLAGQPLVETLFDALVTVFNSEIEYLYLPDIGKLVTKKL
jgi:carbamoyltransferase